jgi:hypothetical protein
MRDLWRSVVLVLGVGLVVAAIVCSRPRPPTRGPLTPEEAAIVSAFTGGTISRESPIRVVFNEPLGQGRPLNAPLDAAPFRFAPHIEGVTVWTAPNRLEFRPSERLEEGRAYSARLDLDGLLGEEAPLPEFEFGFSAMQQSFSVTVEGLLAADSTDIAQQKLTGRLVTADVESEAKVEEILAVSHRGQDLEIAWDHHSDRRSHAFVVAGIVRGEEASTVDLRWDGAPIGVDEKAAREIDVPSLDTFNVGQARAVQGREQYIELRFTDPLQPDQSLMGLVRIGDRDDLRFEIRGNLVEIYGTGGFSGEQTVRVASGVRNALGYRMKEDRELGVVFEQLKPEVHFAGEGVIVPTSANLTVPIEAVNLRGVVVEAIRVPEGNVPQFLQVNSADEPGGAGGLEPDRSPGGDARQAGSASDHRPRPLAARGGGAGWSLPPRAVLPAFTRLVAVRGRRRDGRRSHRRHRAPRRRGGELLGRLVAVRRRGLAVAVRGSP